MEEMYLVLCSNDKEDDLRVFFATRRSDADLLKVCFLQFFAHPEEWNVVILSL